MPDSRTSLSPWRRIPRGVWVLGFVSLFMDLSSEMIHALLPLYLVGALGASALVVGVIEGIAEATASIVKIFSGALSDYLGKRKWPAAAGYGLAAISKPVFPLATGIVTITLARFVDRVGKGIRGAPRDALIADLTPAGARGSAFGLRQSLDTIGAVLGPLAAIVFMAWLADDFKAVFWIAVKSSARQAMRSEEHTSELQSPVHLVCRPPGSPLFPYTTLFRSRAARRTDRRPDAAGRAR